MPEEKQKPQLHNSMMETMSKCGVQFQRRYGARFDVWPHEEIIPPGIALATGISVHRAVDANMNHKVETGELLDLDTIRDVAREAVERMWSDGLLLTPEESTRQKQVKGETIDLTVALSELHHIQVAPLIEPIAAEERFVIELKDSPIDLAGQFDIRENVGIRDTKTAAPSRAPKTAKTVQMAIYSMAHQILYEKMPERVVLDGLIKTRVPKVVMVEAKPDDSWMLPVRNRIYRAVELIESVKAGTGQFTPAQPEDWCCSEKWCGYARTCPFWTGR